MELSCFHNQLCTRSSLVSMFLYCLSSPIWPILPPQGLSWPLFLRTGLCHCPDQLRLPPPPAKCDAMDCQNQTPVSNTFSLITSLLKLPSKLSSQSSSLKLTLFCNHTMATFSLRTPSDGFLMLTSPSLHPTDLVSIILFLLHLPSWPSPHLPLEPKHLPFTEVPYMAPCSRPVLTPSA